MTLPITARMEPRPVWARLERRLRGEPVELPTEDEQADALRVLEAGIRHPIPLYVEAERILHESSRGDIFPPALLSTWEAETTRKERP